MSEYQQFDWDEAATRHTAETLNWLRDNNQKKMTLEEFSVAYKALPHKHRRPSRCKTPSKLKSHYYHLRDKFGFFGGKDA